MIFVIASSTGRTSRASSAARCCRCARRSSSRPRARSARRTAGSCSARSCPTSSRRSSSTRRSCIPQNILLRGGAVVPRRRRPAADRELGPDDRRRHARSSTPPGGTCSSRAPRCCSPCSPSTCSATGCRTPSTRRQQSSDRVTLNDRGAQLAYAIMRRLRLALAGALALVAALALAACGGSQRQERLEPRAARGQRSDAAVRSADGKKGGTLTRARAEGCRAPRPGRVVLPARLRGHVRDAARRCTRSSPTTSKPTPDLAAGAAGDLGGRQDRHGQDQAGIKFSAAAATARSPPLTSSTRSSACFNPNVANGYAGVYFGDIVGADKAQGRPDLGHHDARRPRRSSSSSRADFGATFAHGALAARHGPGAEGRTRRDGRARTRPCTAASDQAGFTGPYMIKPTTQVGLQAASTLVRNPNWEPSTDYRPGVRSTRSSSRSAATRTCSARQMLTGTEPADGDAPPAPIAQARPTTQNKDQLVRSRAGQPLRRR